MNCVKVEEYLMLSSNSVNLLVPSSTGGIPEAFCNQPISSADPRTVFRTREIRLKKNASFIDIHETANGILKCMQLK